MSSFDELYEELLLEMPWMDFKAGEKEITFDLELENFKDSWEGFLNLFKKILRGEELVDKRGEKIQLTSDEEKQAFIEELRKDNTFNMFLFNFFIKEAKFNK